MMKKAWRYSRLVLAVATAIVVGVLVSSLLIELGPTLRVRAESAASGAIDRPLSMERLSLRLFRGRFVIDGLRIEGLEPDDRPFFTAKRIEISVRWWNLLRGELLIDTVDIVDWRMLVETFPGGRHNFPRVTRGGETPDAPRRFVTTVAYVNARQGELTYEDHGMPWSTVARNLDLSITKLADYRGQASFSNGTVQIQDHEPMWADLNTTFKIEEGKVLLDRIDLVTDGAVSELTGVVDLRRWPEQRYEVKSRLQFSRMRQIFFTNEQFTVSGEGTFEGAFHLYKGGRDLRGRFASDLAGVNAYRFLDLKGSLLWLRDRFEVWDATADFYGGRASFTYGMAPLGEPDPPTARFDVAYEDVDLARLLDDAGVQGLRVMGGATGRHGMEWPLGRFSERQGDGRVDVLPPDGVRVMDASPVTPVPRGVWPAGLPARVSMGGSLVYTFDPEVIDLSPSYVATPRTFVRFQGRTAYGDRSRIAFHVTSGDWGESDHLLAGVLTAFGSPTQTIEVGGAGTFDGVMLGAFRRPRVEGQFSGTSVRVWDVEWGEAEARVVLENNYASVTDGVLRRAGRELHVSGQFSFLFPRRDGGEEINARIRVVDWPVVDMRTAFALEGYPIDGDALGEMHLYGRYRAPLGFGRMTITGGTAYGEPFESATAGLRFEGEGVRIDGLQIGKVSGTVTGAAYVGWDGSYSFNADGRRIPVETIAAATSPRFPLSGLLQFTAFGAGTFDLPQYDVRGRIGDLFMFDEGVGQLTGRVAVRGELMTIEVEVASPRLAISGSGRIALTPEADAELAFRFTNSSLDPYVRAFEPRLSPFTTAVASGAFRVVGELGNIDHLLIDGTVEQLELRLFDYVARNDGPIRVALDQHTVRVNQLRLVGAGTALDLTGEIRLYDERIALKARGDANLGILQGFFRDVRSAGDADVVAEIQGPLSAPRLTGYAVVTDGRLRYFGLPHSLDEVNGRIVFDAGGIHVGGVTAKLGGGDVQFGGRISLRGYELGELEVSVVGTGMFLRYPEGARSAVDAELALRRDFYNPLLTGTVTVREAVLESFDTNASLLDLSGGGEATGDVLALPPATMFPLEFDLRIVAPSTLRVDSATARITSSAELTLRGTYDRPLLFGQAQIERGDVFFEGNRYLVTRGTIDFANPTRIEPFFDIEAETRVRVPGQIYRVVFHVAGTADRFVPELTSDPPLPPVEILSLLFGELRDPRAVELRALRVPDEAEQQLLQATAARLLASPISSEVGRVVQETFAVDTFQITPSLGDFASQQSAQLNPTARVLIGKRISERLFLSFARALSAANRDQVILLEYSQSDRLSWVVSQNEDRTYALDFRVRHVF